MLKTILFKLSHQSPISMDLFSMNNKKREQIQLELVGYNL